jgi:hypothetical protein
LRLSGGGQIALGLFSPLKSFRCRRADAQQFFAHVRSIPALLLDLLGERLLLGGQGGQLSA